MRPARLTRRLMLTGLILGGAKARRALARPPAKRPAVAVSIEGATVPAGLDGAVHDLRGSVSAPVGARVHIAIRRASTDAWWVEPDAVKVDARGTRWSHVTRVGGAGDAGAAFRVIAVVFAAERAVVGWIDDQALKRAADAVSAPIVVKRAADKRKLLDPEARVSIAQLDSREVSRDPAIVHDVGLTAPVWGEFSAPIGARVQLVVQPLEDDTRWVMHGGYTNDGSWDGSAQFGRDEYHDEWVRFLLYAIVARPPLVPTRYTPAQWDQLLGSGQILAVSQIVRTRRTVRTIKGQPETSIRVLSINRIPVHATAVTRVRQTATIEGDVTGSAMSTRKVAVYARPEGADGTWRRLGAAISTDNKTWTLLPAAIGENQQRLVVLAVLYEGHPPDLNNPADAARILVKSPFVRVVVVEPAIEITAVDQREVSVTAGASAEAPLTVGSAACRIEGARLRDLPQGPIIFYARAALDPRSWRKVGALEGATSQLWDGAAVDFGGPGSFTLVAVLVAGGAPPPTDRLPTGAGSHISPFVHVKVVGR
jgi:hypothetical protein